MKLTVAQLIEKLKTFEGDALVKIDIDVTPAEDPDEDAEVDIVFCVETEDLITEIEIPHEVSYN